MKKFGHCFVSISIVFRTLQELYSDIYILLMSKLLCLIFVPYEIFKFQTLLYLFLFFVCHVYCFWTLILCSNYPFVLGIKFVIIYINKTVVPCEGILDNVEINTKEVLLCIASLENILFHNVPWQVLVNLQDFYINP